MVIFHHIYFCDVSNVKHEPWLKKKKVELQSVLFLYSVLLCYHISSVPVVIFFLRLHLCTFSISCLLRLSFPIYSARPADCLSSLLCPCAFLSPFFFAEQYEIVLVMVKGRCTPVPHETCHKYAAVQVYKCADVQKRATNISVVCCFR